tara:strand:- start:19717 stop:20553 length:837 start_codon:yes stop_codon:yes gene_type:complete
MSKKTITFRASGNGALMTNAQGCTLTEKQTLALKTYDSKVIEGVSLTPAQRKTYSDLKDKSKAPFQMSDTAKSYVRQIWLAREKGYWKPLKSKYLDKGIYSEEDAISLISEVDGRFYVKNTERKILGNITGECDINSTISGKRIIQDTKSCWSPDTFMQSAMTLDNEWQGRCYMHLYDADEFWLRHVLVDCPDHIYQGEIYKLKMQYNIIDETLPEHSRLFDRLKTSSIYSDNPQYTPEERVKKTIIYRDDNIFQELLDRIPAALDFYNQMRLNGFTN